MKRRRGQGLVEFALILPVLLLVLLGIIEAALVVQGYLTVQHAAREAARFAVTYQPVQGACVDLDKDGWLEDGITQDLEDRAPRPFCPVDYAGYTGESESAYYARRAQLIKMEARRAATGLRVNDAHLGDTPSKFELYKDEPRFFGVLLWGYPSFEADCAANPSLCEDHPGLEGLPVRVTVRHNVQIVDPLYRAIAEYVPVQADAEMINEGVQVGFGDRPPPTIPPHTAEPTEISVPTNTPGGETPTPGPTEQPRTYRVELNVEQATNLMPDDRHHEFIATVTDEEDRNVEGARVSFSTDAGGFSYSGVDPTYVEELTDGEGHASVTLFGNRMVTATLRAWVDYDGDNTWDPGEPDDEATKSWTFLGPYITVSDHDVIPLDYVYVDVMDHNPTRNPHRLLWCVISGTNTSGVVLDPVNVDAEGNALNLGVEIPVGSVGDYRLESHYSSGGCGAASDLVAYSADIRVREVPPDLQITSISWPAEYGDELPSGVDIVFTMVVSNSSPTPVENTYFDSDFYLDPHFPPPFEGQVGTEKQWLLNIGPYGTQVINATFELGGGVHQMWGQVDTTDYVADEYDETNNVSGPYTLTVRCTVDSTSYGDDFNDGSVAGKWTTTEVGSPDVNGSVTESSGRLAINGRGGSIWDEEDNFYFVHQSVSGDFDARLRVTSPPSGSSSAKMGLMVRNSTAANSRHVMFVVRNQSYDNLQSAYREEDGGSTNHPGYRTASWPVWVRIVRSGDTFGYYYSTQADPGESDWTYRASVTVDMGDSVHVGIAHASYRTYQNRTSQADEFMICQPGSVPGGDIKPPGLLECQQVLYVGGFEGNPDTVFEHWTAGEPFAYQHQSRYFSEGSMSMRLHASMGSYPDCPAYHPYLWQEVEIPDEVYTMTTMHVRGQRLVAGSLAPCSFPDTPEVDDVLYLQMQDGGGGDMGDRAVIANGGEAAGTWAPFDVDVTGAVAPYDHSGEDVRLYFYGTHDEDYNDTWFYLDNLECEVCTEWPVPSEEAGTASIGGGVRVLVNGIPQALHGVDVWAYSQGGEVFHTITIQDGLYHFYNIPPGTYTIYSEIWIGGGLRFATTTVVVGADQRNYGVNLFLL
jgi:hypothetical protein